MKKLLPFALVLCLSSSFVFANDERSTVASNVKSVTVYRSGAEMIHTASARLPKGNSE